MGSQGSRLYSASLWCSSVNGQWSSQVNRDPGCEGEPYCETTPSRKSNMSSLSRLITAKQENQCPDEGPILKKKHTRTFLQSLLQAIRFTVNTRIHEEMSFSSFILCSPSWERWLSCIEVMRLLAQYARPWLDAFLRTGFIFPTTIPFHLARVTILFQGHHWQVEQGSWPVMVSPKRAVNYGSLNVLTFSTLSTSSLPPICKNNKQILQCMLRLNICVLRWLF